jgi:hypothetical protein
LDQIVGLEVGEGLASLVGGEGEDEGGLERAEGGFVGVVGMGEEMEQEGEMGGGGLEAQVGFWGFEVGADSGTCEGKELIEPGLAVGFSV